MDLHFTITEKAVNELTLEEYEAFELAQEGTMKVYRLRPVLARFMTDTNDRPIPYEQAMKTLGKVPLSKMRETIEAFTSALQAGAIPLASGGSSPPPSGQVSAVSGSPDGSGS